jgi:hypothetical protein
MVRADFLPADIIDVEFDPQPRREQTDAEKKTDAFAEALASDSEAFVNVSRQLLGGNSPMEFVGRYPADKYDYGQLQVLLQQKYGGGDYRLMLYANGKLRQNKLLSIACEIKGASNTPSIGGEVGQILNTVLERMDRMQQQFLTQQKPPETEDAMIDRMLKYKTLFGGDNNSTSAFGQIKETMQLMELLKGNVIDQESESGMSKLIEALAPVAVAAMNMPAKQPQQTQPKNNPQPSTQNMQLLQGLSTLVKAAAKNANPATYAEMVLDMIDADTIRPYIEKQGAFKEMIKRYAPQAVKYGAWFDDLREHLAAAIGMPSKYSDLYDVAEDDITGEIDNEPAFNDKANLHTTINSERESGDSSDSKANGENS